MDAPAFIDCKEISAAVKAGTHHECFDVDQYYFNFARDNFALLMSNYRLTYASPQFDLYQETPVAVGLICEGS